jgi:hypothetical protein
MKRAFGKYRINKEMNLLEREDVYNSIRDVLRKDNTDSERKWVESTLSFRMVIVGRSEDYSYKYAMEGFNGCIESIELIEKSPV